ncbi:Denticleless protein homolog [Linum perenne]
MEASSSTSRHNKSGSFFQDLRSRELNGFRVRKRPYSEDSQLQFDLVGEIAVEHNIEDTPPLAVSYCKTAKNAHILAVSDEDGYLSLFDTRRKVGTEKARIIEWEAHQNAIFDVHWIKDDTNILTASGDQSIQLWDVEKKKCKGVLTGHTGSVKSLCSHPTNSDLLVSGSRDGSFALWDLRCQNTSTRRSTEICISSTAMVKRAHLSAQAKRTRRGKAASMSITSVLYLKDEMSIATAGAVDSIIKFWDTRNLKAQITQVCPQPKSSTEKVNRLHGISSLSQDSYGTFLTASCMDNRIYLYNVLQLQKGPIQSFTGCRIESFFVKSAISPDASCILSGSSDGNAYLWKVGKPEMDPTVLKGHDGEVTAVDWCQSEEGKIATSADDFTVRVWNAQNYYGPSTRSPTSIRRRIMAIPNQEERRLNLNLGSSEAEDGWHSSEKEALGHQISPSSPTCTIRPPATPEAHRMKNCEEEVSESREVFETTPESGTKSPSSVLNPPSSLKRKTIRDYFLTA